MPPMGPNEPEADEAAARRERLEQLKAAAEAQMRRPAPDIASSGGGRPPKRAKQQQAQGEGDKEGSSDGEEGEEGSAVAAGGGFKGKRYNYAAPSALLAGARCLLLTCSLSRVMSATKEGLAILSARLPAGSQVSQVRLGCNGVVMLMLEPSAAEGAAAAAGEAAAADGEADETVQTAAAAAAAPGATDDTAAAAGENAAAAGGAGPSGGGESGGSGVDTVRLATSILHAIESGAEPRTRFIERIIPVQTTCALQAEPLREAAERACLAYLEARAKTRGGGTEEEEGPLEFAVAFRNRNSIAAGGNSTSAAPDAPTAAAGDGSSSAAPPPLQRSEAIKILADAMSTAAGGRVRVNLKAPVATIIAEVVPLSSNAPRGATAVMCLAVVDTAQLIAVKVKGLQVRPTAR